jgi:Helix-turn-helix of DDE superfamily endonuclease
MMADKLLFILTYLKQHPIQEVQGQLFRMSQSNANKWIHLLQAVLHRALAQQDLLPARTADELTALLATTRTSEMPTPPLLA